jgi:hypothetical protein
LKLCDAITLSGDIYIGLSADEDKSTCLFVFGRGIELKSDEEISIAQEIVDAMEAFNKNSNRQKTGSTFLVGIKKAIIITDNRLF